ncbi:transforming growth factor beta receptor type 3-like [Pollicipes pollicipes]|uniref:transforming growth factor beta receptor type 3-like n=1 Tax=Pollicipes pollicipes TaxID=41117 RepID=UPI00188530CE|nr:transforming growth factor beta receptor type 3-like [Pollicipes pollicipes]
MALGQALWLCTIFLVLPAGSWASGGPELCVVTRLASPDFSAEYHQPVPAFGCFSRCVTADGREVHAMRPSTKYSSRDTLPPQDRPKLVLRVLPPPEGTPVSRDIVLILDASSSVDWTVLGNGAFDNATAFQIVLTKLSAVERTDLPAVSVTRQPARPRAALLDFIVKEFGCITSFTDVTVADLVRLQIGTAAEAPEECDAHHVLRPNAELTAYQRRPVPLDGCYHRHLAGIGQRDVYVIEVAETDRTFSDSDVTIRLSPSDTRERQSGNVTLLLKAAMPVTWSLMTERFSGDILVVTEFPVVNDSLDKSVSLKVKLTRLPDSFNDLVIFAVGYSSGPPVAYIRSLAAHRLNIGLHSASGGFMDQARTSKGTRRASKKSSPGSKRDMRRPEATGWRAGAASGVLRRALSVTCELGRLVVAVPAERADERRVRALRLADPTCRSFRNSSHLVISQPLDDCETRRRVVDGKAVYLNTVHFVPSGAPPDDEDFEGSGSGLGLADPWEETAPEPDDDGGLVPVSCTHPGWTSPEVTLNQNRRHQEEVLSPDDVDSSVYSLELFSDEVFAAPIEPNALVPVTHSIYARATIRIAPYLQPVVEECWVSKDSDPDTPYKFLIIRTACPVDRSVSFMDATPPDSDVFSFQVSRQYLELGPYYLHCRLGVCVRPNYPASPHIAKCVDRRKHCAEFGGSGGRPVASGVQVVTRGPLLPTVAGGPADRAAPPEPGPSPARPLDQAPVVRLGVEPETVAGIGVAAFLLGVTLMGGVWLIHSKIGPSKRHQFQAVPQNPTLEVAGQSANSTPSSQTPIIV